MRLVITGVPAAGKTTISKALAKLLDAELVHANDLAKEIGAAKKARGENELTVDLRKLRKALLKRFSASHSIVVEGHLLCEFALPADAVLVLRCDPRVLLKRYAKRGYGKQKAADNAVAEALDYCVLKAEGSYGSQKVIQVDATKRRTPKFLLNRVKSRKSDSVDWTALLVKPPLSGLATRSGGKGL
jgi:adenylate kinase